MRGALFRRGLLIGVVVLILGACTGIILLPDTSGIEVYPESRNQVLGPEELVSVAFDRPVNRQSVEDIFLVEEAAGRLAGSYRWESWKIVFVPDRPYVPGRRYVATFSGTFEDVDAISYTVHHSTPFFSESAGESPPGVLSVTPPGGSTLGLTESILITFSASVDPATLLRGISLSPPVDVEREVDPDDSTGKTVILRPRERWNSFTVYKVTVTEELGDLAGRPLLAEYQAAFLAQEDATAPELLVAEATTNDPGASPPFSGPGSDVTVADYELFPGDVFRFTFSEAMDRDSTERALSLSPSVAGTPFWPRENVLVFVPNQSLRSDISYTLLLETTATDRSGIPLAKPLSLQIEATPESLLVTAELVEDALVLTESQENAATVIHPGLSPDYSYNIALTFSEPFETEVDKLSLRQAIELTTLLSNDFTPPFLVGYSWPTDREIRLTYNNVVPSTPSDRNYLLLSLPGGAAGVESSAGNQLESGLRILLLSEAD